MSSANASLERQEPRHPTTATTQTASGAPVRSEALFCVLDAARELLAAYAEYESDPGATCLRCGEARRRLRATVNYFDTQNAENQGRKPAPERTV